MNPVTVVMKFMYTKTVLLVICAKNAQLSVVIFLKKDLCVLMPKRQKAKVVTGSPINKTPSARKVKRIADQNEREAANKELSRLGLYTYWEIAQAARRNERIALGVRAKWRKANRSSIGEKPNVNNTLF